LTKVVDKESDARMCVGQINESSNEMTIEGRIM